MPIPTHRHLDYSRVQRKVTGNTRLATHLCCSDWIFCAWKLICAIHHGVSLHSKWTESREKLGYQSLLFQQAALRGGESAPFLRAATVSYRGCLEQTLHYINPDRKGKKGVGATKALFQYSNLEVLKILSKIIREWKEMVSDSVIMWQTFYLICSCTAMPAVRNLALIEIRWHARRMQIFLCTSWVKARNDSMRKAMLIATEKVLCLVHNIMHCLLFIWICAKKPAGYHFNESYGLQGEEGPLATISRQHLPRWMDGGR